MKEAAGGKKNHWHAVLARGGLGLEAAFLMASVNALINAASAVVIVRARRAIAARETSGHCRFMIAATILQAAFLVIYLTKWALFGTTPFQGDPAIRAVYLVILGLHTLAATAGAPLVLITLLLGLRHRYAKHRVYARWAYPIWLFVSVTGPLTYLMLYGLGRPGYGLQALGVL